MKTTLTIIAALMLLGCKKEETPEPDPVPVQFANQFTIGTQTYQINNDDTGRYGINYNRTYINADGPNLAMSITLDSNIAGQYEMGRNTQNIINVLIINGTGYVPDTISINCTEYGPVGGNIKGSFAGTFFQTSDTTQIFQASGQFSVTRLPDF